MGRDSGYHFTAGSKCPDQVLEAAKGSHRSYLVYIYIYNVKIFVDEKNLFSVEPSYMIFFEST